MRVTILGPNLPKKLADKGTLHVHAAGCADIQRNYRQDWGVVEDAWTIDADSLLEVVGAVYPPEDFLYDLQDPEDRAAYVNDVWFAPCARTIGSG